MKFLEFSLTKSVYPNMEAFGVHLILSSTFQSNQEKLKKKNYGKPVFDRIISALIKKMYNPNLMHLLK